MGGLPLEPDAVIGGRYRLRRPLGEGGMAWIWEACHVFTHKPVALKFVKGGSEVDRRRFQREVRAAAAIRHPNVIDVHDVIEGPEGALVMAMELLDGETLSAVLAREKRIALADLAAIVLPVLSAVEAAHAAGVIHRDLKPDNIFLAKTASGVTVKTLDFGVAKLTATDGLAARTQALTGTGSIVGTPYYMSPEQVFADKDIDFRADVWSLGVLMYECLAGVRPTEDENVGRVLKRILVAKFEPIETRAPELPADVASLVMRMLSGDRDARPRDLAEIRAVLERYAAERIPSFAGTEPAAGAVDPPESGDAAARGETNRGVSLAATTRSSSRARLTAVLAVGAACAAAIVALGASRGGRAVDADAPSLPVAKESAPSAARETTPSPPARRKSAAAEPGEAAEGVPTPAPSVVAPVASANDARAHPEAARPATTGQERRGQAHVLAPRASSTVVPAPAAAPAPAPRPTEAATAPSAPSPPLKPRFDLANDPKD